MYKEKILLLFLLEISQQQFKALLRILTEIQVKAIKEIIVNLLAGNIEVTEETKNTLAKYKTFLIKLARSQHSGKSVIVKSPLTLYKVLHTLETELTDLSK